MSKPNAWCPECGPLHRYDGRGCCPTCGYVCQGPGANAALKALAEVADLRARLRALRREAPIAYEPYIGDSWTSHQCQMAEEEAEENNGLSERILRITDLRRKDWRQL